MSANDPRATPPTAARSLILKVDVCRGLFAFLVVVAHAYDVCWVIHPEAVGALPPGLQHLIHMTIQSGIYWVMGFFVISGYCIQLSVGRLREAGRFPLGVYLAARFTRIMPLYYLGLLFALLVEAVVAPARASYLPDGVNAAGWISQLFFAQRPFQTFGSFAATWSISNEFLYYVIFGLLAAVGSRHRAGAAWLGMAACVGLAGLMQALYLNGHKNWYTLQTGLMFGLGINWFLGALVAAHGADLVRSRAVRAIATAWPLVLASAVAARWAGVCPDQANYLLLGLAFAMMLLRFAAVAHAEAASGVARAESRRFAAFAEILGLSSYPTYLFHGPILLLLASANARWGLIADWRATWAVLAVAAIVPGIALGVLAERPLMSWRAGLLKGIKARAGAGDPAATSPRPTLARGA